MEVTPSFIFAMEMLLKSPKRRKIIENAQRRILNSNSKLNITLSKSYSYEFGRCTPIFHERQK